MDSRGKSAKVGSSVSAATVKAKFSGLMTFLAILGGVTGVVSIGLTLWFAYTGGNLRSPSLEFGFGAQKALFGGDLRKTGLSKNGPVQYLVIGSTQAENNQRSLFMVPFYLKNSGSRSLHDVMVRMTYPGRVFPPFSKISIDQNHVFMPNPEYAKFRTRTVVGDSEVVEYTFPVLRPGEGMFLGDSALLGGPSSIATLPSTKGVDIRHLAFPARLREQVDLLDVVKVQTFVAASEAAPYTTDLTIVWAKDDVGQDNMPVLGDRVASAAWGVYRPKPGLHFRWFWKRDEFVTGFFELEYAPLKKGVDENGNTVYVQQVDDSTLQSFSTAMPSWDFWGLNADNEPRLSR